MEDVWIQIAGEDNLDAIIGKIGWLPSMPWVVNRMLAIIEDENSNAEALAEVISKDQTLTARVLKMVNSAYYGFERQIATVSHAVAILGFNAIRSLVISLSIFELFKKDERLTILNHQELWLHSISVAVCASDVASRSGFPTPEETFVCGLLHDIGKALFNEFTPEDYTKCIELARQKDTSLTIAEQELYGFNHATFGAWLAAKWELPEKLQATIAFHHGGLDEYDDLTPDGLNVSADSVKEVLQIVEIADMISKIADIGFSGDYAISPIRFPGLGDRISEKTCIDALAKLPGLVKESAGLFGLDLDGSQSDEADEGADEQPAAPAKLAAVFKDHDSISLVALMLADANYEVVTLEDEKSFATLVESRSPDVTVWAGGTTDQLGLVKPTLDAVGTSGSNLVIVVPPELEEDAEFGELVAKTGGGNALEIHLPAPVWKIREALIQPENSYQAM